MDAQRLPLPQAYADPAFHACLAEAINTPELAENFDRLYHATLTTKPNDKDMGAFVRFVHDGIYLRLPDEAIHSLRKGVMRLLQESGEAAQGG